MSSYRIMKLWGKLDHFIVLVHNVHNIETVEFSLELLRIVNNLIITIQRFNFLYYFHQFPGAGSFEPSNSGS